MEIALHPLVTKILECAAGLTMDSAQRRWALGQAASVGRSLFQEADPEGALFRIVSSPTGQTGGGARSTANPAPSRSEGSGKRKRPDMEIALPPFVTRILECIASLTPDNAQRRKALAQAAAWEDLFFHEVNSTGTQASRFSRVVFPLHGGPTRRKRARHAQPRTGGR